MSNQDHHDRAPEAANVAGMGAKGAARRRFAKAGLGATGVILTLASKPGMASVTCTSASGFASGPHASQSPGVICEGRSPGYWKNWPDEWRNAYTSPAAKFGDVFTATRNPELAALTLMEVLQPPKQEEPKGGKKGGGNGGGPVIDVDPDNVARHIIAALLNARSQKVPPLSEAKVFEIWNEYTVTKTYSPRPGTDWNGASIVFYLKTTMI